MSELFYLSPAGYLAEFNYTATPGSSQFGVTPYVRGLAVAARTTGQYGVSPPINAVQGVLRVSFTAGPIGAPRALAFLVDNGDSPTKFMGLGLDADNRPLAFIQNRDGAIVAKYTDLGPSKPEGTQLVYTLAWKASEGTVSMSINGVGSDFTWIVDPSSAWDPFAPMAMIVGSVYASGFQSLQPFNGTLARAEAVTLAGNYPADVDVTSLYHYLLDTANVGDTLLLKGGKFTLDPDGVDLTDSVRAGFTRLVSSSTDGCGLVDSVIAGLT